MSSSGGPNRWRPDLIPAELGTRLTGAPAEAGIDGDEWLARLPHLLGNLLDEWELTPDGASRSGHTAVVVPVVRDGEELALKVGWPHPESAAEHLALQRWSGGPAVRLARADPSRGALLLDRLNPDRTLNQLWIDEACEVIGALLAELHQPAGPDIPRLTDWLDGQFAALAPASRALPRRVIDRTRGLLADLGTDDGAALLHTDLHFENVLWHDREERWVAIDPKPLAGHPGFELHPVLRNRTGELGTGAEFRWSVRHRIELVCDAAGIDEQTARHWTYVAATLQALWAVSDTRDPSAGDTVTWNLTLQKALED